MRGRWALGCDKKEDEAAGTITVFLSLILLIILSLLFTIIEGARIYTAGVMAERALTTAMDSVLAEYYGPLWEEYHIFGRYLEGDTQGARQEIQEELKEYISYTIHPGTGSGNSHATGKTELYHLSINDINVEGEVNLLDYQGQLLIKEAVEYTKYQKVGAAAEELLGKLKLLQTPNQVSFLMEKKQELQEELVQIDKGILKLMKLFDGIETSNKGIKLTREGTLKITDYFIKRIYSQEITMHQVGINRGEVFEAVKGKYFNPGNDFRQIEARFGQIEEALLVIENIRKLIEADMAAMSALSRGINANSSEPGQIAGIQRQLQAIQAGIQAKEALIALKENTITSCKNQISRTCNTLKALIQNTEPLLTEAITCINGIQLKVEVAAPLVDHYEQLLAQEKESLEEATYAGLEEGLGELKQYVGSGNLSYDFDGMKQVLQRNIGILKAAELKLTELEQRTFASDYQGAALCKQEAEISLSSYQISGLTLDYSTLVLDKSNQDSVVDKAKELLGSGLCGLVIDPDTVSKAERKSLSALPSELASLAQDDSDQLSVLKGFFQNINWDKTDLNSENLFQGFGDETSVTSILSAGINKIAEIYLFEEYLREHFNCYQGQNKIAGQEQTKAAGQEQLKTTGSEKEAQEENGEPAGNKASVDSREKPSLLTYEQEYLIVGKASDKENLYSVIMKIIFLRTILNFITVVSDSTARAEAKAAAVAIVGFTGLPILIGVVQVLVLIIWALEEALFDTCALLSGKEVPLIKNEISLKFHELFLISRGYLEKKVQGFTWPKGISLSYQNYLQLFLLMGGETGLAYRSMDLMQENIRLRYEVDTFEMENCYFGFCAGAEFGIERSFTEFSFVRRYIPRAAGGYSFTEKAEYCY
ncbi:MAG TPA: hypothetical protein GXX75_05415 [Clostridiales bacterium]|nr:hypothetical protein [Clostridiales bacterium]